MSLWTYLIAIIKFISTLIVTKSAGAVKVIFTKNLYFFGFTGLILILVLWNSGVEAYEQQDPMILINEMGSLTYAIDYKLENYTYGMLEYEYVNPHHELKQGNWIQNIAQKIWFRVLNLFSIGDLLINFFIILWFYVAVWKLFFAIYTQRDDSERVMGAFFAFFSLWALQLAYYLTTLTDISFTINSMWHIMAYGIGTSLGFLFFYYFSSQVLIPMKGFVLQFLFSVGMTLIALSFALELFYPGFRIPMTGVYVLIIAIPEIAAKFFDYEGYGNTLKDMTELEKIANMNVTENITNGNITNVENVTNG